MNIAAVLVATTPPNIESVRDQISAHEWADVHHINDDGRMMITIEGDNGEQDIERLKSVKSMPNVISAEMVEYCFDEAVLSGDTDEQSEPDVSVPEYLNSEGEVKPPINHYVKLKRLSNF